MKSTIQKILEKRKDASTQTDYVNIICNQQQPLWQQKLQKIDSIYVNNNIKEIVESSINKILPVHDDIYKDLFQSNNLKDFFYCRYLGLYLDNEQYYDQIKNLNISEGIYDYFMKSNSRVRSKDLNWCKGSSPFMYMFDNKLNPLPKTDEDAWVAIKQIQEIFKTCFIEEMIEKDGNLINLKLLKFPNNLEYIKEQFIQDSKEIKDEKGLVRI